MVGVVGAFAASAALLAVSGAPKIARPATTAAAVRGVITSVPLMWVRLFGAAEVVIGVSALCVRNRFVDALVAASYLGFAAFIALALRHPDVGSCGCFAEDAPPTASHLVLNAAFAAVAVAATAGSSPSLLDVLRAATGRGLLLAVLVAVQAWLAYLAFTRMPEPARPADQKAEAAA